MKIKKQIFILLLITLGFLIFDGGIYFLITKRCTNNFGSTVQPKMINVDEYLPFDDNSNIVKLSYDEKITENIPVFDGATALLPIYSAITHSLYPVDSCNFDGTKFTSDSKIQYRNTSGAYKALVDRNADIIFCAQPSTAQSQYAKDHNFNMKLVPIGFEAFVFIVNKNNPIDNLSSEDIRKIYAGEITNWKKVGGINRFINPLTRKNGSGSQTAMECFMKEKTIKKNPFVIFGGSIGFSFRYYVEGIVDNSDVKMISVDGIYPSEENIRNGTYPIINNFYAIYDEDTTNPNIAKVIDYILSSEGQEIINKSGYVGVIE